MPRSPKKRSILAEARSWATNRRVFGTQAFLKYVILRFTENLNQVSDEIVFKGGNLLWVYIGTPRATVDLDLATLNTSSHARVRQLIEKACEVNPEIRFSIHAFKEIEQEGKLGAAPQEISRPTGKIRSAPFSRQYVAFEEARGP